jgi:hypothetical protein
MSRQLKLFYSMPRPSASRSASTRSVSKRASTGRSSG